MLSNKTTSAPISACYDQRKRPLFRVNREKPVWHQQCGFTLLELILVLALSGPILYAGLSTHSHFWTKAWQGQTQVREVQSFYSLGHWLVREIRAEQMQQASWQWQANSHCLMFANKGVRLRNKQLQWKPNDGDCNGNGWLGLHDAKGYKVHDFTFTELADAHFQLCISGQSGKASNHQYGNNAPLNWCYQWYLEQFSS
ncbi:hypothetical protein CWE08_11680 [Aliidiomarina iranensis]|uniref:Prepilin-type cleavage/methylation domain-containing protein n=1 Tax=Aliidiomarina iranensis TaxID=1434071 RepID=A0A432VQ62_9GAMM|nr:prepilin-type N-terminal cleavage/methylation domain-containing protein [Aliidiomarina iranensis]RUO18307.1 hypothetical protein CWE08_11680 [Aliidiomarina iranensis]